MITRSPHRRTPGQPWQPPAMRHEMPEGAIITSSVRNGQLNVTVRLRQKWSGRLRRTWEVMLGAGDTGEFRETFAFLLKVWRITDLSLKVAVCVAVAYLFIEIGSAFVPGSPAFNFMQHAVVR